jgi:hypothetical protein
VVAKPPGTRTLAGSWLIISPREAFLPPTCSTSLMRSSWNGMTLRAMGIFLGEKEKRRVFGRIVRPMLPPPQGLS